MQWKSGFNQFTLEIRFVFAIIGRKNVQSNTSFCEIKWAINIQERVYHALIKGSMLCFNQVCLHWMQKLPYEPKRKKERKIKRNEIQSTTYSSTLPPSILFSTVWSSCSCHLCYFACTHQNILAKMTMNFASVLSVVIILSLGG